MTWRMDPDYHRGGTCTARSRDPSRVFADDWTELPTKIIKTLKKGLASSYAAALSFAIIFEITHRRMATQRYLLVAMHMLAWHREEILRRFRPLS